ncbi:MAG: hypothetical protein R3F02_01635 [Thiolinea sp.]
MDRKPIQLTTTEKQIYALCDDGSMWRISERLLLDNAYDNVNWERLPSIPYRAKLYIVLGQESITKPVPDFLKSWEVELDAMGDEQRYLKCSKYTPKFTRQDYELLDKFGKPPKNWPNNL